MKKYILVFAVSFVVFFTILGGVYYLYKANMTDKEFTRIVDEMPELKPDDPKDDIIVNTLLMGVDEARSDIMIVASYNKENNKITMLSIPRDTRVEIPGHGYDKINSAAARKEGVPLAMETVSNLLGIPIHYYIKVDFKGAERIIDILGGVKIKVPMNMDYDDPAQHLSIHIKKGEQVLNGANAVKFVRFRSGYPDQDLGRIKAQQEFIKAFAAKLTSPKVIPKALSLIDAMSKCVKTNMEQGEIAKYALKIPDISLDNIKLYTIPGEAGYVKGVSYYMYDKNKLEELLKQINTDLGIEPPEDAAAAQALGAGPEEGATALAPAAVERKDVKLRILNSTKKGGLANQLKAEMEKKGYQVVGVGNTKDLVYSYSRIVDKSGNKEKLDLVSGDLGLNNIENDIDITCGYDITVIIGNDRIDGGI